MQAKIVKQGARVEVAQRMRGLANRLAVNCHAGLREIESVQFWNKDPELRHWWAQLHQAQVVLNQAAPTPESRIERELMRDLELAFAEPDGEPVEAPPRGVTAGASICGSAGSGGGIDGGVGASSTPKPNWLEIVGER